MAEGADEKDGHEQRVPAEIAFVPEEHHAQPPAGETAQYGQKVQDDLGCAGLPYLGKHLIEAIHDKGGDRQGNHPYGVRVPFCVAVDKDVEEPSRGDAENEKDDVVHWMLPPSWNYVLHRSISGLYCRRLPSEWRRS